MSSSTNLIRILKVVLPVLVLILAVAALSGLSRLKKPPERQAPREILPAVEFVTVSSEPVTLRVDSQGTVQPRTQTRLTARVSGLITDVSPAFEDGGFFREGDVLLTLDPLPYEAALAEAKAALAARELALEQELALSEQARIDWEDLGSSAENAPGLVLRKPQLQKARADVEAARAAVRLAEQNLQYTRVRAPYDGRIRSKLVDVGQSVTAQATALVDIYATDFAEIRLPLELKDVGFLELQESFRDPDAPEANSIPVILTATYGADAYSWKGWVDRVEGAIDPDSRMTYVVAKIEDPYRTGSEQARPPLKVGMYVEATIEGEHLEDAVRIPRSALQPDNSVYRITHDNRLEKVFPEIVKTERTSVIVGSGLEEGDRLSITPLLFFVDGMRVNPAGGESAEAISEPEPDEEEVAQ